jgi:hypothetical protein
MADGRRRNLPIKNTSSTPNRSTMASGGFHYRAETNSKWSNVAAFGSAYALGKQGIYFISLQGGVGQHLAFLNFATGQVTSLADIPRPLFLGLTVSPDERILLYSQMDHVNCDLMLVEHFHWRESSVLDLTSNAITVFR